MSAKNGFIYMSIFSLMMLGCASSKMKERKEQREKMVQASHLYCDFINGEVYQSDVEVVLNLEMAKKCDSEKPFSVSQYRTPSENQGLIFCCSLSARAEKAAEKAAEKSADKSEKKAAKADKPEKKDKAGETPANELE